MFDHDYLHLALRQGPFRCDRPRCPADAVQVAPRSQGLVKDALFWLADQGERKGCVEAAIRPHTEGE